MYSFTLLEGKFKLWKLRWFPSSSLGSWKAKLQLYVSALVPKLQLGNLEGEAPALRLFKIREARASPLHSQAGAWERAKLALGNEQKI
jgi:hypothetical protein